MHAEVASYMSRSATTFIDLVKPLLTGHQSINDVLLVENETTDAMRVLLDVHAGIDAWAVMDKGLRGIASRIQPTGKNWRTFTVRKSRASGVETEFEKRDKAIRCGYVYPYYTMQVYTDMGSTMILGLAVCKTVDLIALVQDGVCYENRTGSAQVGQASFYVVRWQDFIDNGKWLYEMSAEVGSQGD